MADRPSRHVAENGAGDDRRFDSAGLPTGLPDQTGLLDPAVALNALGETVFCWDPASDALVLGANAAALLGPLSAALASGAALEQVLVPGSGRTPKEAMQAALAGCEAPADHAHYRTRYVIAGHDGRRFAVEEDGRLDLAGGRAVSSRGVWRVRALARLAAEEGRGGPTPREELLTHLAHHLKTAAEPQLAILSVVIANNPNLAALHGEAGIDAAYGALADRLRRAMRGADVIVGYGGQRFGLVLDPCPPDQVAAALARFAAAAEGPVFFHGRSFELVLRFGAATPRRDDNAEILLGRAERDAMAPRAPDRLAGEDLPAHEIVAALNERRICLALQPVVEAATGHVAFREALVRLRDPGGAILPAGMVVSAAERAGIMQLVDHRMLELAAGELLADPDMKIAVNLSRQTLADPGWLDTMAGVLGSHPGIADRLIVEITETAAVSDPDALAGRLDALKALGVLIALDDFGAGHTSFRQLRRWPVDLLKIDGAFIQSLDRSGDDRFFVRTLIDLAQHLGIATVAEWVDGEPAAALLRSWGVDYLQGNLVGRPVLTEVRRAVGRAA